MKIIKAAAYTKINYILLMPGLVFLSDVGVDESGAFGLAPLTYAYLHTFICMHVGNFCVF